MSFIAQKRLVQNFYKALDQANTEDTSKVMNTYCAPDLLWRGYHPFNEIRGPKAVSQAFWQPLKTSLSSMQRRLDVFFAGDNIYADPNDVWVCSMGHLMGLFDAPWLGIAPTHKLAMLRYAAFHKVVGNKIVETAMYFDIPHLMIQAGLAPFPSQSGEHLIQPGPRPHDGLLFEDHPPEEGEKTLAVIDQMARDLGQWNSGLPLEEELRRTWHEDMLWWGPAGIGATYTIPRYVQQHAGIFRSVFTERTKTQHICRIGEGHYGGFFGWPNFVATPQDNFMGLPTKPIPGEFRVIDVYRREGDKLKENWIFIDALHFWKGQGIDILAQAQNADQSNQEVLA